MTTARVRYGIKRDPGAIPSLAARMESNANMAVYRYAMRIQREARVRAPVRTGYLKSSIKATRTNPGAWRVEVGASYGHYVEYGTRHMMAQPYFRPAIEAARVQLQEELKKVFKGGFGVTGDLP